MVTFKSRPVRELLRYFFLNEDESAYVNELAGRLGLDKRNMVRKLKALEEEGLLTSEMRGNQRYYGLDKSFPLYQEYRQIFLKTVGFEVQLKAAIEDVEGVRRAFIFGSYADNSMGPASDVDIVVVGNHSVVALQKKVSALQKSCGRDINAISMSEKEFNRKKTRDPFMKRILGGKIIELV
jgi:predicted nucleotidyltransferase